MPNALPRPFNPSLEPYRDLHAGASLVVCGCGTSAAELAGRSGLVTIGVNDIGRLFDPTYLVVVNPPSQFRGDRFAHVRSSRAQALFTQTDPGAVAPPLVPIRLGRYGGTDIPADGTLHYTQNSPYVAVCLAAFMGARRIGLIGVDFTDHHFFGPTGRHPLAARLATIDREYGALAQALAARGVELVNLSPVSRLQSLPRSTLSAFTAATVPVPATVTRPRRVFVVNYRFVSCGDVFADGLRHAAQALGVAHAEALHDDPLLPERVERFAPDLLLVVHGRRFVQRWGARLQRWRSAVWLVDEPYEVDDTAAWSHRFDHVFVNDPATLARHPHAHYVPMAFDPEVHRDTGAPRSHAVGFIGGANPTRERFLLPLAEAGLLGYLVGGPWQAPALRRLTLATRLPHLETARLYQQTRLVLNVFRDRHHFNARAVPAVSMNPRVYEALACGAMVLSERRAEIGEVFPLLPQFDTPAEMLARVQALLADAEECDRLRRDCVARLTSHRYADRLVQMLQQALADAPATIAQAPCPSPAPAPISRPPAALALQPLAPMPRRHLLYHLWPVRGGTWRWNVQQLLQRVDLFNGRRIVAIATDGRCEDTAAVQAAFEGHGFEFIVVPNSPLGESVTFPRLLECVADEPRGDVCFYAHAKGVKYEPEFPPPVRRWAEVQYAALLDHWPSVREQLDRFAMTGILRRLGRFGNHRQVGDWHYSGTFFWFRHDAVFARRWAEVPDFYGGVEAWPGVLFSRHETGCLLLDNLRELPYHARFWAQRGDAAVARWKQQLRPPPVPADLARPLPFDGGGGPRLEQKPDEFGAWLQQAADAGLQRLLVIGSPHGGVEWHVARRMASAGRPLHITTLHEAPATALQAALADAQQRFGVQCEHIAQRDDPRLAAAPFDAAFIDGDHGFAACRHDVDLAFALGARQVALHDIVDSDWHAHARCCVSRVWAGLQAGHRTGQWAGSDWGGIGVAWAP